ncbi:MAG: DNA translocase FtsK [Flavobacteriales bacterium]|nr:DNA translocase FtsK [Flavobacteriales bacterium]
MAKNTIKNQEQLEEVVDDKPKKPPRSKSKNANGDGRLAGIRAFFADRRVQKIFGIFLVLFSVFLFVSCLAHIFFHEHDEFMISGGIQPDPTAQPERYQNWMGSIGAHLAQFFMKKYFGFGALFLPLIFFLWGIRIWLKKNLLPFWKSFRLSIVATLFFPVAIGFAVHKITDESHFFIPDYASTLVGGFGAVATEWMLNTLGWIGTLMSLLFVVGAFLIFNFNNQVEASWKSVMEWLKRSKEAIEPDEEEIQKAKGKGQKGKDESETTIAVAAGLANKFRGDENELEIDPVKQDSSEVEFETVAPIESTTTPPGKPIPFNIQGAENIEVEIAEPETEEELTEAKIEQTLKVSGPYDPKLDLSRYVLPNIELLKAHGGGGPQIDKEELESNKNKIVETLNHYKIEIAKIKATIGPTVTLYEIVPAPGVRISKIKNLEDDIALSLAALGIRIIAPIPGKGTIGIEVPNSKPDIVSMRSLIASDKFQNADMELPIVLGKTISNETFVTDLSKMPHLLMAGATGQGKSVGLNAILVSLLYKKHPSELKFVLVDPKKVELTLFNKIERHFLAKLPGDGDAIITDTQKVVKTLTSLCIEMDNRYELLKDAGCRNLKEYNGKFVERRLNPENGHRYLPYIVLVVDEFADLIMTAGREVETPIARLAQLARAIGIHLVIATQRPSVNIITGVIKANFPARIAFRVTSKIDSRTILDSGGADQLIGRGDMLLSTGNDIIRIQCGFVDTPEVDAITEFIGSQQGYPEALILPEVVDENTLDLGSLSDEPLDELFEDAARIVVNSQQGSASLLQRKLKLGYNRAGRLVDQLEAAGVIGQFEGSKARKVLLPDEMALEQFLKNRAGQ